MASHAERAVELFGAQVGHEDTPSEWQQVDQARIDQFADATGDHQFIHVDPERARQTPFGTTIAHGFLTLSLLPALQAKMRPASAEAYEGLAMGINYGLNRVRFPAPVKVDSRIRARRELLSADLVNPNTVQLTHKVTIDIEREDKPACVVESLTRLVYT